MGPINRLDADAGVDVDVAALVPVQSIEPELLRVGESTENARQQDAVVRAVRLRTEHADLKALSAARQDLLDDAGAGHAGAHDNHGRTAGLNHGWSPQRGRRTPRPPGKEGQVSPLTAATVGGPPG